MENLDLGASETDSIFLIPRSRMRKNFSSSTPVDRRRRYEVWYMYPLQGPPLSSEGVGAWMKKIIDLPYMEVSMAKSLGQIHTTNFNFNALSTLVGEDQAFLCDNSAKLSTQFNRNIRMMQSYKWVGADLVVQLPENINPTGTESTRVTVKGRMRYFAPTKGRCQALRDAYKQLRTQARVQGIDLSKNRQFDFRVLPRPLDQYPRNVDSGGAAPEINNEDILNTTTLNGTNELCMVEGSAEVSVFEQYNLSVRPNETSAVFNPGLQTQAQAGVVQTDFVLNEGLIQGGNPNIADILFEEVPFELSYDLENYRTYTLQWRPDPALYVSVLGGFVEIVIDEMRAQGASGGAIPLNGVEMDVAMHWAGWKSIVNPPRSRSMKKTVTTEKK